MMITSCSKDSNNSEQQIESTKKLGGEYLGTFPGGPLGLGPGLVEIYGGEMTSNFMGAGEPREMSCDGFAYNCFTAVRFSNGINKSPMNNTQRTKLHTLCSDGSDSEIQDYFLTGEGSIMLNPMADIAPEYWEGLRNGTMTILLGTYHSDTQLSTIIVSEHGTTLENFDINSNDFYAFEI